MDETAQNETVNTSHFWICDAPLCTTVLLGAPGAPAERSAEDDSEVVSLTMYDCDGALAGSLKVGWSSLEVGVIDLRPLLVGCKVNSGFRHGHLVVKSKGTGRYLCRYQGKQAVGISEPLRMAHSRESVFVPIRWGNEYEHTIVCVNSVYEPSQVTMRLMLENRSPEVQINIPPHGVILLSLEKEFNLKTEGRSSDNTPMQGYVKFSCRSNSGVGVQLLERSPEVRGDFYRVLA